MTIERWMNLVSRSRLTGALLLAAAALPACAGEDGELDDDVVEEARSAIGPTGSNDIPPQAIDSDPLKREVTDSHLITTSSNANPIRLCKNDTVTSSGCTLKPEWQDWMDEDPDNRTPTMKGIAKCAVESGFTIRDPGGMVFDGQWGLYTSWKTGRLTGQDKRERISACILSLLNGNNEELDLCILGPGGAPFSDACSDPTMNIREGGFFGDLFAATPTAYVAGPDTADPALTGRACFAEEAIYCCPESDPLCGHRVVLVGSILGSPEQGYANKRCNAPLVGSGGNFYCPSFFSTLEPERSYTNAFTTFVPPLP